MRNLIITKLNGDTYDLLELGIITKRFLPSSPRLRHETESIGDGEIKLESYYEPRNIKGLFFMYSSYREYSQKLSEVYNLFQSKEEFYVTDSDHPGRRWKVQSTGEFSPERIGDNGEFDINFISFSPFAESISTTLNPSNEMQIMTEYGDPPIQYEFNSTSFKVWNDGDETINPRRHEMTIEFSGDSSNLAIKNLSTGDEWNYTGDTTTNDVIKIEGVRSIKNGLSIFRQTNRKLLSLQPGWNEFEITGATDFTISFDFRYLYI